MATLSRSRLLRHPLPWIFLLALAVRLIGLGYHSLWFDEVISTMWAAKPASEIWRAGLALTQDKHPPLYYLLLHGWTQLLGPSDGAVRLLGVLIGALAMLPIYDTGQRLGGRRAATLGALLAALNPFLVWYSQEARMFMPATTFALLGLAGVLRLAGGGARGAGSRWQMAGALAMIVVGFTAALYSYLFSALVAPVAGVWLALLWWQGRGTPGNTRRFLLGAMALALVVVLFLPLARNAWLVSAAESTAGRAFDGLLPALPSLLTAYSVGWPQWAGQTQPWLALAALLLGLAGMVVPAPEGPRSRRERGELGGLVVTRGGLYLATWLAIPLLIGGVLLARDRTVFAETRYFIFLVPALCLAWGRALAALWTWRRAAGWAGLAAALTLTALTLPANWSPERRREAWRETAAYVMAHAGPNDALLFFPDYIFVAFDRYFDGPQGVFFPFTDALNDPAQVDGPLQGLAGFDVVWLVESHHQDLDPAGVLPGWFAARYPLITEQFPPGIDLRAFATRYRLPALPQEVRPLSPRAALDGLQLLACQHESGPISPRDDVFHPPSNYVHVTTYWTTQASPPADLFPDVRLVDAAGQVWGEALPRQDDAFHLWPTSRWLPGEVVRADYDVNLNPITPAGMYRVVVSLPGSGKQVACGEVTTD